MTLKDEELERYARHIILRELGGPGQQKLRSARVLVIGAGGLGAPVLMYLAAAGVGTLGVIDDDQVSLSNLQRQIIHSTEAVGTAKVDSAREAIERINPHVTFHGHGMRFTPDNALELLSQYDIVADGSDNFATRFLVCDACFLAGKTLVSAAVGQFDGQISTFKPHETQPDGTPYPSYRCLHPEPPPDGLVPTCEEAGILGALTGIIGSMQAMEVIKEIADIGDSLAGRVMMYDALSVRVFISKLRWDPDNPLTGQRASIRDLSHHKW